jgi:hypothetical protein
MSDEMTPIPTLQSRAREEAVPGAGPVVGFKRWLWPLQSRKVQVALATIIVAYAAHAGVVLSDETVTTVLAMGAALILGIAHEDAGKAGAKR